MAAAVAKHEETDKSLAALQESLDQKEARINQLSEEKSAKEKAYQEKAAELDKTLYTMQALRQEVVGQPQAVATIQQMLDTRNEELAALKNDRMTQLAATEEKLKELQAANTEQIKTLTVEKQRLSEELV